MKKIVLLLSFLVFLLVNACTNRYLTPISSCQPLGGYKTIVITPMDGSSAKVEETKYIHLPPYIARVATEKLGDLLEFHYVFPKVVQSSACVDQAVRFEGKILSLDHYKGDFHVGIRGRLIDCQSNRPLYLFEHNEEDSDSVRLPGQIADKLFEGIKGRLICQ